MNKYSIEKLDKCMTFNHSMLNTLFCESPIPHKLKRVDDFEFSLEILNTEDLNNVLAKIITFCSERFWKNLHFKIDKIITRDIIIDRSRSMIIDVVIIKSNQQEILIEVFIYQGTTNLHSMILTAENANIVKLKENYIQTFQ